VKPLFFYVKILVPLNYTSFSWEWQGFFAYFFVFLQKII